MNKNHVGEVVGIFEIIELMPYKDKDGHHTLYKGICKECGISRIARYHDLKSTIKCNHISADGAFINYETKWDNPRFKSIFRDMKQRCYNEKEKAYRWYGAKGIKICDEWLNNPKSFEEWSLKNGYKDNLTIDRIDENKDYSPNNCRWVTHSYNTKYKSTTSLIDVDGEIHTGRDWSKILGFNVNLINSYIRKYGYDNTIKFIKCYLENPGLKPKGQNKSIYDLYMHDIY